LNTTEPAQSRLGLIYGLGAYGLWGIIPLYFYALRHLAPLEVLAHRVVWSFVLLAGMMIAARRWDDIRRALRRRDVMLRLAASTLLIAVNWFTYIYSVSAGRVLESSLGYFITPLVNVLLGIAFLGERLRPVQLISLLLAAVGVLNLALRGDTFPWIALVLAVSFAFYGLMRKTVAVDAPLGLFVETSVLTLPAIMLLGALQASGTAEAYTAGAGTLGLLVAGGLITTVPLLLFAGAARRLQMATLGFLQYLAPSIQFVLAAAVFGEALSPVKLISFGFIWSAVALYTIHSLWTYRARRESLRGEKLASPSPETPLAIASPPVPRPLAPCEQAG
jgi:chloramphenicol-sensitive protein RarD